MRLAPFTAMMSLENDHYKCNIGNTEAFLSSFWRWPVKGLSAQRTALKVDSVTGPENILFAGTPLHLSARTFYRLGQ